MARDTRQRLRRNQRSYSWVAEFFKLCAVVSGDALIRGVYEHTHTFVTSESGIWSLGLLTSTVLGYTAVKVLEKTRLEPRIRQTDIISRFLRRFGDELFEGSNSVHRVTLFQRRKRLFRHEILVPTHRYRLGHGSMLRSRARFRRGEGMAGIAWNHPRQTLAHSFPGFVDIDSFRNYQRKELKLSRWRAMCLSRRMFMQRWLLCFGIVDYSGETVAVLSIDSDTDVGDLSSVQVDKIFAIAITLADYLSVEL